MRKLHKRIIAGILAGVTLFFACIPPAYASGLEVITSVPVDFWTFIQGSLFQGINDFKHMFDKDVCPMSTKADGLHSFKEQRTTIDGKTTLYYICEYCGKSAGEVGNEAYQQQVESLPAPGYNSSGDLLLTVPLSSHTARTAYNTDSEKVTCSGHTVSGPLSVSRLGLKFTFSCGSGEISGSLISGASYGNISGLVVETAAFSIPYTGYYQRLGVPAIEIQYALQASKGFERRTASEKWWAQSSPVFYEAGHEFPAQTSSCSFSSSQITYISSFRAQCYPLVFKFIPAPDSDFNIGDTYNITTRPTVIDGGNYGIVGDDGQIITINNPTKIINEGDNIYYNPATGQTYTITDWTYNYDNRIYNITLDTGDKVSVEYGDQNITITENNIVEGDTIINNYTIYYIIDGPGDNPSPTPGPTTCPHDWQAGTSTAPTCTAPGKTAYTCPKCGETKTETLPALGHDWQAVRTVPTEYDENGTQTQAGYTLYECTRCGEQYKDTDSTGPPGNDTPDDGGLIAWLNGLIKSLSDNLSGIVDLILRFFREIPELFGGFTAFLAAVFPFLPDEIMLLLTFGMAALVVVGVIKVIRR